ncbi:Receptor-like protein EIX2 [Camellia lanceoleosa]|uniref:Receptor-like protein EIX2 n=1 Tax=Camellia lanceoleosa TaxID=1840588 RepID=A0ACC0H1H6_9ERIC|nr:Receptor-like protein EIX2 [Camellia lanceoleosa]
MRKFSTIGLLLVVLLCFETAKPCLCSASTNSCAEDERLALLKFKHSLTDAPLQLSTWHGQDCCNWKGVQCDGITGHVVKLDLHVDTYNMMISSSAQLATNKVDFCLLELKYLNHLDLSGNKFQGSPIPEFFGAMTKLRYLNLSDTGFSGMVPHHLGNLSSLRVLDLKYSVDNDHALIIDDLTWVSRLSALQYLDMSRVNLSEAHNLHKVLNMLPSLLELRLSYCGLDNSHLSHMYVNSTVSNVQYLDLGHNSFEGEFPSRLSNMTSLRVLDLSFNYFNSSMPLYLENLKSLEHLNLGSNQFNHTGGFLRLLSNHCSLKSFDMSQNQIHGEEMSILDKNLSRCTTYDLETLILTGDGFTGHLPNWLGQLKHLKDLDLLGNSFNGSIPACLGRLSYLQNLLLGGNLLTGNIPTSLGNLSTLRVLDLSSNHLNGTIPISIGQLSNLKILDLSFNSLQGVVSEAHFANLSMLEELKIGSEFLTLKLRSEWIPPFQLESISLWSCKLGTQFPQWLQTQKKLSYLDLVNTSISGTLPEWLHDMNLVVLGLPNNHISGPIPNLPSTLFIVDLSNNSISGPLPQNIGDMVTLSSLYMVGNLINGSIPVSFCKIRNLVYVDLSKNMLSGNLPRCLGDLSSLNILKFSSNKLSGVIPNSIGHLTTLVGLYLNNNSLYGELPSALGNCRSLTFLNLGENGFNGSIPRWIGELKDLAILRLHKNMFNGSIPLQLCQLPQLLIMDLADNKLKGTIPRCFGNLKGMISNENGIQYNLGGWLYENIMQIMKGNELEYTTSLLYVVNMDLSRNNLVGTIPEELTLLSGLLGLNLSHNNLSGSIPKNINGLKSLESLDFSNNQLSSTIPQSMSALNFLSHLNLSYNNFSGHIPTGKQLQTLDDPSIYIGNDELCGAPLPKKCPGDEHSQSPTSLFPSHVEKHEGDEAETVWFYLVIMSGYATGLWGVIGVLLLKKNWRHAYFQFVARMARMNE